MEDIQKQQELIEKLERQIIDIAMDMHYTGQWLGSNELKRACGALERARTRMSELMR